MRSGVGWLLSYFQNSYNLVQDTIFINPYDDGDDSIGNQNHFFSFVVYIMLYKQVLL